jgi:hypothetical protein
MTRTPSLRRLFDMLNACPWNTRDLRIDHVTEILVSGGMTREAAEQTASEAYAAWDLQTRNMLGG